MAGTASCSRGIITNAALGLCSGAQTVTDGALNPADGIEAAEDMLAGVFSATECTGPMKAARPAGPALRRSAAGCS